MSAKSWDDLLALYLMGSLSEADRADFEAYLAEDAARRNELAFWQTVRQAAHDSAEARAADLPPLKADFYARLRRGNTTTRSSPNGLNRLSQEDMSMATFAVYADTRRTRRIAPLTLVAAVMALMLFGLLLLAANRQQRPEMPAPLAGVMQQEVSPTPTATLTPTSTFTASPSFTSTSIPITVAPAGGADLTLGSGALPPDQIMLVTLVPTVIEAVPSTPTPLPVTSLMQPIVSAPTVLAADIRLSDWSGAMPVFWSPEGSTLALMTQNGVVQVFNADDLTERWQFGSPAAAHSMVTALAYNPDGAVLALGLANGQVRLVDALTGSLRAAVPGDGRVSGLVFSPDGATLAIIRGVAALDALWLFDTTTAKQTAVLVYDMPLANVIFSPDSSRIAVTTRDGRVFRLNLNR